MASRAERFACDAQKGYEITLSNGTAVHARALVIATGVQYRRLTIENLARFEGTGVYYAATTTEARLCGDSEVAVVGGANSAGQAAVFLAGQTRHVHVLIRGTGLADTMSRYLIRRIEETPNITLHPLTEIVALGGDDRLRNVTWRGPNGTESHPIAHVFLMIGAQPNSAWLGDCVALDDKGFVKTGTDLHDGRLGSHALAGDAHALPLRDEPASRVRRRRRSLRKRQAGRVRSRRGLGVRAACPSRAGRVRCHGERSTTGRR